MTIMMIFVVVSVIAYQIQVETTASSHAFDNNDEIRKTGIRILDVNASSSSKLVNFTLTNQGSEKLWNYDEFDIIVTYDADILGTKTKVTEQFTYNANALLMSPTLVIGSVCGVTGPVNSYSARSILQLLPLNSTTA